MLNINDLLPVIPIFCTLDPDEIATLKKYLDRKQYAENTQVFHEGDPGDGLFVVAVGAVKITKNIDGTNEKVLAGFAEKEFFGELALLDGKSRSATATATRTSVLLKITAENFNKLMVESPFSALKIVSQIACHLSMRLRDTNIRLSELENYRLLRG